jgi:hypothetical protein
MMGLSPALANSLIARSRIHVRPPVAIPAATSTAVLDVALEVVGALGAVVRGAAVAGDLGREVVLHDLAELLDLLHQPAQVVGGADGEIRAGRAAEVLQLDVLAIQS